MEDRYYILTTKFADCLNRVLESGRFQYLRRSQPDSGPFLDLAAHLAAEQRANVLLVLFDRVPASDTFKRLVGIYRLVDTVVDRDAGLYKGREEMYALILSRVRDLDPPLPFGQGTPLWDRLATTRGRKTTSFYGGGRMLLPLPSEDFQAISTFTTTDGQEETEPDLADTETAPGIPVWAESELRDHLAENLDKLEMGLEPLDPDKCVEYPTGDGGRIDILCRDRNGMVVVVELKKGRGDDRVVGQLCRYIGWAKEELAKGDPVRGIIVANVISNRLRLAARAIPDVRLIKYEVKFDLSPVQ